MAPRPNDGRRWSLEAAQLLLGDVRARTEHAVSEIERLEGLHQAAQTGTDGAAALREGIDRALSGWVREMEALGVEVKGPWLVDFDCGSGYYCWRWPESELAYFHGYDEGYESRVRIQ